MNKCLKITLTVEIKQGFLQETIQKNARAYELEGMVQQIAEDKVKIIVCGEKEQVDHFVDALHKESLAAGIKDIEIEPHVKDKDYRGVFRVIE
jgi:acylphosphatase